MRSSKIGCLILLLLLVAACGGGGSDGGSSASPGGTPPAPPAAAANVLLITVNGSLCSANSVANKACVGVTVCAPGTTDCRTITDILVDTGSFGLRIFKSALTDLPLPQVTANNGSAALAECVQFADGSADWGPVQMADVRLGNEPAVRVPIHVIDAGFGTVPGACGTAKQNPAAAGYNGILGIGIFAQDCGPACANFASNGLYYACIGAACSGTRVPLTDQVQNPVALLPVDNNGVIIQLPAVPAGGVRSLDGQLVLGIDTRSNNAPSGVAAYAANDFGEFTTTLNGTTYSSFIDSSSNGLFFPPPSGTQLPECPAPFAGWFCPSAAQPFTATNTGANGTSGPVSFQINNAITLFNSGNRVFAEIGGTFPDAFDWGLPFHFGRNVYVGIEGTRSTLGTGPYWAY